MRDTDHSTCQDIVNRMEKQLADRDKENDELQARIAELHAQISDVVIAHTGLQNTVANMREDYDQLRQENERLEELLRECLARTIAATPEKKGATPLHQRIEAALATKEAPNGQLRFSDADGPAGGQQ